MYFSILISPNPLSGVSKGVYQKLRLFRFDTKGEFSMKTKYLVPFLILLSTLLISACATASAQELNNPTALPPVQDFAVIAEGRLVPNQSV
jgi:hypothetical protein